MIYIKQIVFSGSFSSSFTPRIWSRCGGDSCRTTPSKICLSCSIQNLQRWKQSQGTRYSTFVCRMKQDEQNYNVFLLQHMPALWYFNKLSDYLKLLIYTYICFMIFLFSSQYYRHSISIYESKQHLQHCNMSMWVEKA